MACGTTTSGFADLRDRYLAAQLAGDRAGALALVLDEGVERGVAVPDLHLSVIQEAQHEIGRMWQDNRISIAEEHVATAISQLAVAHLYRHLPRRAKNGKRVLVACVEGELHELGPRIASDFLEMAGFEVSYLGANVPTDSLVSLAARKRPDLIAVSASLSFHVPALRAAVEELRKSLGKDQAIAVGGHALTWAPSLAKDLDATVLGADARELVESARRVLGVAA